MTAFEQDIEEALPEWGVPGLSCSAVTDGAVSLERGFGVRTIGDAPNVDEDTLFAIGSVSKSFTGTAIAMLVDEGKLSWDSKVIDYLESFRLYDPFVTRELTIRDLLVHRSGLDRGDFMWYKSGYAVDEVLSRVRHLQPAWGFRTTFGYQNIMYTAAGELIRNRSGMSWDDFVTTRLLQPLRMSRSRAHIQYVDRSQNLASSHAELGGTTRVISPDAGTNSNAAGSIYSSARDMARWLRLHLSDGSLDGDRLLTSGSLATLQTPQMLIAYAGTWASLFPEATFLSYGMGWFIWSYRGQKIISHGGNIDGMTAAACVVPDLGFGVCVLANTDGSSLPQALVYRALDDVLGKSSHAWISEFHKNELVAKERMEYAKQERERERILGTVPSRPLPAYAGTYGDAFYGDATVTHDDNRLTFAFIGWEGDLEHLQFDSFRLRVSNAYLAKYDPVVRFTLDDFGRPSEVTLILLGALRMHLSRAPEQPAAVTLSSEEQAAFAGVYECTTPRVCVRIERLADTLLVTLPGSLAGAQSEHSVLQTIATSKTTLGIKGTQLELRFHGGDGGYANVEMRIPHQQSLRLSRITKSA